MSDSAGPAHDTIAEKERFALLTASLVASPVLASDASSLATIALIPAAGYGTRAGFSTPKQYQRLGAGTVLGQSVKTLAVHPAVKAVVVVLAMEDHCWESEGLTRELGGYPNVVAVRIGGPSRRDSVLSGLDWIDKALGAKSGVNPWIMVHDAARPAVSKSALDRLLKAVTLLRNDGDGAILACEVADTLKKSQTREEQSGPAVVSGTISREGLWMAQTPQVFRLKNLIAAYRMAPDATDEASAMEARGANVVLVASDLSNFKLTRHDDFELMQRLMASDESTARSVMPSVAIGQGFDVHALVTGRPLVLGGVTIPFEKGLEGHSDADVLLHAIADAVLGAAGLGDIGRHFPDTDPAYRGADSRVLLKESVKKALTAGFSVAQVDATVIAQAPKIAPYALQMQTSIAQCCGVDPGRVNVKGKTTEHLGFTGRGEGIAAQAVVMLSRLPG